MPENVTPLTLAERVEGIASQCVKCALCLPHCPTYQLTQDENESPRGRIALMQALANDQLPLTDKVHSHLSQCLGCRACERVCPAHVEYEKLLCSSRALLPTLPHKGSLPSKKRSVRFLGWILTHPALSRSLHWVLWALDFTRLRLLARKLGLIKLLGCAPLDALLPRVLKPLKQPSAIPVTPKRGRIELFEGCLSQWGDQQTLLASRFVLHHLGFDIAIPPKQTCCGAMALHTGQITKAHQLAKHNALAFNSDHPIISFATGCGATLQEYDEAFSSQPGSEPSLASIASRSKDIVRFILEDGHLDTLPLSSLPYTVMVHTPCTQRNALKTPQDSLTLLSKIPGLTCQAFASSACCGSAGTYMLDHPSMAQSLADVLLDEIADKQPDYIVTTNIGCGLHLRKQLQSRHRAIPVIHPVTLLAKALGF